MNGLQRSTTSFRRQGSSGLIWDDKFSSGDLNQMKQHQGGSDGMIMRRSQSDGGGGGGGGGGSGGYMYQTTKAVSVSPSMDAPPSPKVSRCGLCGVFSKSNNKRKA